MSLNNPESGPNQQKLDVDVLRGLIENEESLTVKRVVQLAIADLENGDHEKALGRLRWEGDKILTNQALGDYIRTFFHSE